MTSRRLTQAEREVAYYTYVDAMQSMLCVEAAVKMFSPIEESLKDLKYSANTPHLIQRAKIITAQCVLEWKQHYSHIHQFQTDAYGCTIMAHNSTLTIFLSPAVLDLLNGESPFIIQLGNMPPDDVLSNFMDSINKDTI
jgi:hypothetical protein